MTGFFLFLIQGIKKLLVIYVLLVVIVFALQRELLFQPSQNYLAPPASYNLKGFEIVKLITEDNVEIQTWYKNVEGSEKVVLLFFGNSDTLENYAQFFQHLTDQNISVLGVCYRGYCGNEGSPSEEGLYSDARAAIRFLQESFSTQDIVVVGRSLGSGVAVQIAKEANLSNVVLISGYTSIPDVASEIYWFLPVHSLARDWFDNASKIPLTQARILLIHGGADKVINVEHSRKLHAIDKSRILLLELPGYGHNNLPMDFLAQQVIDFINAADTIFKQ